jgi:hypothetical protein
MLALPASQTVALLLASYLLGSVRTGVSTGYTAWLVRIMKSVAALWFARIVVVGATMATPDLSLAQLLLLGGITLAVLAGDALPLDILARRAWKEVSASWVTLITLVLSGLAFYGYPSGLKIGSVAVVLAVTLSNGRKSIPHLLPLLALVPIGIAHFGQHAIARNVAYGLFGFFLVFELIRVARPAFNRRLIVRWPWLFAPKEEQRPLGISSAATATALLIGLVPDAALETAAALGLVATSLAKSLDLRTGWLKQNLWRQTSRGYAVWQLVASMALLPVTIMVTHVAGDRATLTALVASLAALLPLPVDRYLLSMVVAAGILTAWR